MVFFFWCIKYSNIEYQYEILKISIIIHVQKKMAKFGFGCKLHIMRIHYKLEGIINIIM